MVERVSTTNLRASTGAGAGTRAATAEGNPGAARERGPMVRSALERETVRVGVIGSGFGASVHVPALRRVPGIEVVGLSSANPERLRERARDLGIPHTWPDYRAMLRSGAVDAVTIATPPHLHHPMVLAAAEARVHVLCEKPIARNVSEARDMLLLARQSGICHAVALHRRNEPAVAQVQRLVADGYIGQLHSVSVTAVRSSLADPRQRTHAWLIDSSRGGGILSTVGSHVIDLLRWWFGDVHWVSGAVETAIEQRAVEGLNGRRRATADDNCACLLRFAGGGLGSMHLSYTASSDAGETVIITGSNGTLAIQEGDVLYGSQHGEPLQRLSRSTTGAAIGAHERTLRSFSILGGEWVWAMRTGTDAAPSFADGVKVQEVVDAVARSQQLSRWIDLSGNRWPV